jgi:hypothetical protein
VVEWQIVRAPAAISVFYGPRPPTALPIVTVTV